MVGASGAGETSRDSSRDFRERPVTVDRMPKHGDPIEYQVGERTVRVSSPDKVYFPERGITKRQVVEYYIAVGEPLLRAIGERPTTLKRYVDGVTSEPFYAKRVPKGAPAWVDKVEITFPSGRKAEEIC